MMEQHPSLFHVVPTNEFQRILQLDFGEIQSKCTIKIKIKVIFPLRPLTSLCLTISLPSKDELLFNNVNALWKTQIHLFCVDLPLRMQWVNFYYIWLLAHPSLTSSFTHERCTVIQSNFHKNFTMGFLDGHTFYKDISLSTMIKIIIPLNFK